MDPAPAIHSMSQPCWHHGHRLAFALQARPDRGGCIDARPMYQGMGTPVSDSEATVDRHPPMTPAVREYRQALQS